VPRRLVSDRVYFARQSSFVMTLRRITTTTTATTNLPFIRVHDHHIHNMDMSSESYRSRPLAIPAPRNISPTSSRASSFHDQPPPPPPLLSLLPCPPSNPPEERQASWKDSDDGEESLSHRWFDVRDRQPSSHPISSPRGWGSFGRRSRGPRHASPGSIEELNIKREPSQSWPDNFRGRQKPPSQLNKELSRPALLKSILFVTSSAYTCHKNWHLISLST